MIIWISGNSGSGKSWLSKRLDQFNDHKSILLDGDDLRRVWTDLDFSKEDRWENNLRIARLAKLLHEHDNIIVSVIAPYKKLREEIDEICHPVWIYMPSNSSKDKPYELPVPREKYD